MSSLISGLFPGAKPLTHQVAGHMQDKHPEITLNFLETSDGCILKLVQAPPRGPRELAFYEHVFEESQCDPLMLRLRPLLPVYLGAYAVPQMADVVYLRIEDLTKYFKNPCIVDIKMGRITYDPEATAEKIQKEKNKYPPLEKLGFQIRGARVFNAETDRHVFYDKEYLQYLNQETVLTKGLAVFYNKERGLRRDVINYVLQRLRAIQAWFQDQRQWSFYASSILIVYDGSNAIEECDLPSNVTEQSKKEHHKCQNEVNVPDSSHYNHDACSASALAEVRMIDFAHVFPTNKRDDNYLFGLRMLIKFHEQLLVQ